MKKQQTQEYQFWERREKDGITVVTVPEDVYIRPAKGRTRYAKRWGSYITNDPRFGPGSLVSYRLVDTDLNIYVKDIYIGLPDDILEIMLDNDGTEFGLQRLGEEHGDYGDQDSGLDENGNYHCGSLDKVAFEQWRRDNYEAEEDEEPLDESQLIAPFSDNPRIRNKQVQFMCGVINRGIDLLPPKNQDVFYRLYGQCMKEVDIAADWKVGKSAISNQKNRLNDKIGNIFRELGYQVPSKEELKAEKKAAEKRIEEIERQRSAQHEDRWEIILLRRMTTLFYEEGMLTSEERELLERGLDEAA